MCDGELMLADSFGRPAPTDVKLLPLHSKTRPPGGFEQGGGAQACKGDTTAFMGMCLIMRLFVPNEVRGGEYTKRLDTYM